MAELIIRFANTELCISLVKQVTGFFIIRSELRDKVSMKRIFSRLRALNLIPRAHWFFFDVLTLHFHVAPAFIVFALMAPTLIAPKVWSSIDIVQAERTLSVAFSQEHRDPVKAVQILEGLTDSLHPQVHSQQFVQAHLLLARSYMWMGEAHKVKKTVDLILNHPKLSQEQRTQALVEKAKAMGWLIQIDEAIQLFNQTKQLAEEGEYTVSHIRSEAYLAMAYAYQSSFSKALFHLNMAFSLMETQGRILWLWSEIFSIAGRVFFLVNDQEEAMEYIRKANRFLLEMENPLRLSLNLTDQARILAKQGRADVALEFFEAANIWIKEVNAPVQSAYIQLRTAEHLIMMNDYKEAEKLLVFIMLFGDEKQDVYLQVYSRFILVNNRLKRDELDDVSAILSQSYNVLKQHNTLLKNFFSEYYLLKAQYHEKNKEYRQAFSELERYWQIQQSLIEMQRIHSKDKNKSELSTLRDRQNRLLIREVALKSNEVEKEQQQKMILGSLIAVLLLVLAFVGYLLHKNIKLRRWLHELSSVDELTKVANRRFILEFMEQEVGRAHRYGTPFCAALLDIDHFKTINDTYGHHVGDEVLKGIAQLYHQSMREHDKIGRYGGEEFILVFPHTHVSAAKLVLDRLRQTTEIQVFESMLERQVTVSIGLAELSESESVDDLLKRADEVLYEAKRSGRNRVVVSMSARQESKHHHA